MSDVVPPEDAGTQAVLDLPFVHHADDGDMYLWRPETTGDRKSDIALGEHYARLAMFCAKEFDLPILLASVMRDMVLAGNFGGVEAGFIATVSTTAQAGSLN